MNTKKIIQAILSTIVRVAVMVIILVFIYRAAVKAYDFGYLIFDDKPVAEAPGRDVTISITMGESMRDIGELLESKGLVKDATIFFFQNFLSSHRNKLAPGTYTLNTSMTAGEMMEIMSEQTEADEIESGEG